MVVFGLLIESDFGDVEGVGVCCVVLVVGKEVLELVFDDVFV